MIQTIAITAVVLVVGWFAIVYTFQRYVIWPGQFMPDSPPCRRRMVAVRSRLGLFVGKAYRATRRGRW